MGCISNFCNQLATNNKLYGELILEWYGFLHHFKFVLIQNIVIIGIGIYILWRKNSVR